METKFKNAIKSNIKCAKGNINIVECVTISENRDINFEDYRVFAVEQCEKYILNQIKKEVKKEIRNIVKLTGASIGYVRYKVEAKFTNVNFEDYKEYTQGLFAKKFKNVQTAIRSSVRYQ